jgi:hypothetical protein
MEPVGADDHARSYLLCCRRDPDDGIRSVPDEPGHPVALADNRTWLLADRIDERGIEGRPPHAESRGRATIGRDWEGDVDLEAGSSVAIGHAVELAGAGREDALEQAQSSERRNAWGHDPFTARLVPGEPRAIDQDNVVAVSGEQEGGRRATRSRAHDHRLRLDHGGTLAERAGSRRIAADRAGGTAGA